MERFVSDQGPNSINELFSLLVDELKISHHFTTAYSLWAYSTVERVCCEVLRGIQAVLHDFGLGVADWPALMECTQAILYFAPLKSLSKRGSSTRTFCCPLEVVTGLKPT